MVRGLFTRRLQTLVEAGIVQNVLVNPIIEVHPVTMDNVRVRYGDIDIFILRDLAWCFVSLLLWLQYSS